MAASDRGPGWPALSDFACHRGAGSSSRAPWMAAWLQAWAARLDELGIAHGGIVDARYGPLAYPAGWGRLLHFAAALVLQSQIVIFMP